MSYTPACFTAIVLSGRPRAGDGGAHAWADNKCHLPIAGRVMLERVVDALAMSGSVRRLVIVDEPAAALKAVPALQPLHAEGLVRFVAPGESAPASALKAFEAGAGEHPALLVTGDSALLTPAMVDGFCAGVKDGVDLCVGFAREETVAAAYPETRRTYLRFRDGGYSSCNLFALMTPQATRVLALWRDVTRHRKRPWRLVVAAFGWGALLRYMMGGLSLADAFAVASARLDLTARPVVLPFADAAIDVDKPSDFALAETILKARNAA